MKNLAILSFIFILLKINIINNVSAALSSIEIQSQSTDKLVTGYYTILDEVSLDTADDHQQTDLCASFSASCNVSPVRKNDSFNITTNNPLSLSTNNAFSVSMYITTKDGHLCGTLFVTQSTFELTSYVLGLPARSTVSYQYVPAEEQYPGCNNSRIYLELINVNQSKQIIEHDILLAQAIQRKYSSHLYDAYDTLWRITVSDQ